MKKFIYIYLIVERIEWYHHLLSRKDKGSNNRQKARRKLAKLYKKLHIIDESQIDGYVIENLNVQGMIKNRKLAKAIGQQAWSTFISYLKYKADWAGKHVIEINRFDLSSKS